MKILRGVARICDVQIDVVAVGRLLQFAAVGELQKSLDVRAAVIGPGAERNKNSGFASSS